MRDPGPKTLNVVFVRRVPLSPAFVAQVYERLPFKERDAGYSPAEGTIRIGEMANTVVSKTTAETLTDSTSVFGTSQCGVAERYFVIILMARPPIREENL